MTNSDTWSLLYAALLDGLKLSRESFQLVYPFTSWTWPVSPPGYISAAEHDFCATMPQWSGVGRYASSGTRFNDAYGNFLSILVPTAADPGLQQKITFQQGVVQNAKNSYDTAYAQADLAYREETGGTNVPTFTDWLATPAGSPWLPLLQQTWDTYEAEGIKLEGLVAQTQDPALKEAMAVYSEPKNYLRYQDPGLSGFPKVPGWGASQSPAGWLQEVQAGKIPGAQLTFSMKEPPFNYKHTWAGGSLPVATPLFAIQEDEAWVPLTPAEEEQIETVSVSLAAWSTLEILPSGWYAPLFVAARANGPFLNGYSGNPDGSDVYLWGEGGAINLRKTGMMVAYQPQFTITFSPGSAAPKRLDQVGATTGFRVGPLVQEYAVTQRADPQTIAFAPIPGDPALQVPQIFGVRIEMLPGL